MTAPHDAGPSDDAVTDWSGLEVLGVDECRRLLAASAVGRVAFVHDGSPSILPVNFAMDGAAIVFRTGVGSKLAAAVLRRPVGFEVDSWNRWNHTGWSVVATGVADEVVDPDDVARLAELPVRPWTRPDLRSHWVRITVEELTGRRIRNAP